ncbi:MAG: HAD family hydrolase [Oscillospiraceae bacterium]
MLDTIIFDLDGTLINSLDDLADSCNIVLDKLNFPTYETEKYKNFIGNGAKNLIKRILPENTDNDTFIKAKKMFDKIYSELCLVKTAPYPQINDLIKYIKNNNFKTAIVSNKPDDFTKKISKALFKDEFSIDVIVGQSEKINKKPNPAGIEYALKLLNSNKKSAIYIGDSDVDVKTAHNANLLCIGASWGFRGENELKKAGADFIALFPNDIITIIEKINKI